MAGRQQPPFKLAARESLRGTDHLRRVLEEAQAMVNDTLVATPDRSDKS
jgi:hypothetical protein